MASPALALDAALASVEEEDAETTDPEELLSPPLAALEIGGHKTISFFGACGAWRAPVRLRARPPPLRGNP